MSANEPRYVHGHHESVLRSHRWRTAANSAAYLLPHLAPGMRLLDVGCGPGSITIDLAALVAPGEVSGIDAGEAPLADARDAATTAGAANVTFRVADGMALPFEDRSFDVVHAHQVLQHVPDPVGMLREMRRVIRPGGIVAARDSDYAAFTWYPSTAALDEWLDLYRRVARASGGDPDAGRSLLAWAHAAGFSDVTAGASAWCFATDEDRAWWGGLWTERALRSTYATQSLALGLADQDVLERISAGWRAWSAEPDGWFAILHGEIIATA
ncbi:MAG: methyltransferase domain-containing protein [Candidatus Limnocylindrales bacterium]